MSRQWCQKREGGQGVNVNRKLDLEGTKLRKGQEKEIENRPTSGGGKEGLVCELRGRAP